MRSLLQGCVQRFQPLACLFLYPFAFIILASGCNRPNGDDSAQGKESQTGQNGSIYLKDDPSLAFLARWDELPVSKGGVMARRARSELLDEAVATLNNGSFLARFIVGLHERRESSVVDKLLSEHRMAMFSGKNGVETREWLTEVNDVEFRKRLAYDAGYFFTGPGLKDYLFKLAIPAVQESFLTGYACRLAEADPAHGVSEYKALRPVNCSFYGLLEVVEHLAPEGDYPTTDALFPDDYDTKNNMGAELRRRLLRRWSSFHPEAAAEYVAKTPKRVKPEAVRVVIGKWAETKPEDALAWLEKTPIGPLLDAGLMELALVALKAEKPTDAWQRAAKIGDLDLRVKMVTEVFKAWEQTDRAAAEKAWGELFPSQ